MCVSLITTSIYQTGFPEDLGFDHPFTVLPNTIQEILFIFSCVCISSSLLHSFHVWLSLTGGSSRFWIWYRTITATLCTNTVISKIAPKKVHQKGEAVRKVSRSYVPRIYQLQKVIADLQARIRFRGAVDFQRLGLKCFGERWVGFSWGQIVDYQRWHSRCSQRQFGVELRVSFEFEKNILYDNIWATVFIWQNEIESPLSMQYSVNRRSHH